MSRFRVGASNLLQIERSSITKCHISISGIGNKVVFRGEHLTKSHISITGENNTIIVESGVGISNGNIIIRGKECIIQIGKKTTFGGVRIVNVGCNNTISIGNGCLFSDYIEIWGSDTHYIYNNIGNLINMPKPIYIHDNVWVGSHVTILKGVRIGEGAIIGMNSVVTKDIEPACIYAGNPVKCIRRDVKWSLELAKISNINNE
jgi:acetyltransferase-like isoleucine patch superfamily enzyme